MQYVNQQCSPLDWLEILIHLLFALVPEFELLDSGFVSAARRNSFLISLPLVRLLTHHLRKYLRTRKKLIKQEVVSKVEVRLI